MSWVEGDRGVVLCNQQTFAPRKPLLVEEGLLVEELGVPAIGTSASVSQPWLGPWMATTCIQ